MGVMTRRLGRASVALLTVGMLAASTACSTGGEEPSGGNKNQNNADVSGKITLVVNIFADQGFGYEKLIEQYMKDHPDINIQYKGVGLGLGDYNTRLTQWMASGQGAGDIIALEEGTIVQFKEQANNFVNLLDYGAGGLKDNFLSWKWEQGKTVDGKLIGLGTDVGSMAICYRKDLFRAANMPTDRNQVGALWPTWADFIQVGRDYAKTQKNSRFVDSAGNIFNTLLLQRAGFNTGYTFFNKDNKLVLDSNPDVKWAWNTTVDMIEKGLSAGLQQNTSAWSTGFRRAQFATVPCPAWMTGIIRSNAGERGAGNWDIAKPPGGGGNWGGSFLAVPKQSKHPKEAAELAKYLTSPQGQIQAFKAIGALPSSGKALKDPAVTGLKSDYFSNAPIGQIFASGALSLKPVYLGSKNQPVRDVVEAALRAIEADQRTPKQAWQGVLRDGKTAAK